MLLERKTLSRGTVSASLALYLLCSLAAFAQAPSKTAALGPTIWRDPGDIKSKNLFNGPGGEADKPQLPVKFVQEDKKGHNAKFDVEDANGQKWKAKLGIEAQPETVASRLLWAVGYYTNENYFIPDMQVDGLPAHLSRGQEAVTSPGHILKVRLQRPPSKEKKTATWNWKNNPFKHQREFNGLRVMMALISNWDLKDENNAVYTGKDGSEEYLVTDVGTAFGASGDRWTEEGSKNNLGIYQKSEFVTNITKKHASFSFPRFPPFLYVFDLPHFLHQVSLRWIGNGIPREDAKWIGSLLGQLSTSQIEDAFRAGGYPPDQAAAFTKAVQRRIDELNRL